MLSDFATHLATTFPNATISPMTNMASSFPAITFQVRDGMREQFYVGSEGMRRTKITLNIYTRTYVELQTIKDNLTTTYHGFSGTLGTAVISRMLISSYFEEQEKTPDDSLYRCILELEITD